jgi:sugar diacid utilization regulator
MPDDGGCGRQQLATRRSLLVRSLLLAQEAGEPETLQVVAQAAESATRCQTIGILAGGAWQDAGYGGRGLRPADVAAACSGPQGGRVRPAGSAWAWAYPIPAAHGLAGFLVVGAEEEPPESDHSLLQALAQLAGIMLASGRWPASGRADVAELRAANQALRRSMQIHDELTQVTMRGEGQEGIARVVHELTGRPAGIEDAFGNVVAWAAPDGAGPLQAGRPDGRDRRAAALQRMPDGHGPVRDGNRLVSVARIAGGPVGMVVLADPGRTAGAAEQVVLEHATTALATEIARLQNLGESLARARSNLSLDLVNGADEASALGRAQALGYDLGRPHRVVAVEPRLDHGADMEAFGLAVRTAASTIGAGSLIAARTADVIVLADADVSWPRLHGSIQDEPPGWPCSVGIGGSTREVADFPRSHHEAQLALRIQKAIGQAEQVTVFDDLGVYQLLATEADTSAMEAFVQEWLGHLMDYDAVHGAQLITTLSEFLACGGSYSEAARALLVHRSTLKYRLRRIREISGHDLGAADVQFNLQVATRAWRTLQALRGS